MQSNIGTTAIKFVIVDVIGDILYWPIWWYSRGLINMALFCLKKIQNTQERLGIIIWMKNLFTPMYGQYDIEGRLISFFMRLIQIIFRSLLFLVWVILMIGVFLVWIIFPILIVYNIIDNFLWLFR